MTIAALLLALLIPAAGGEKLPEADYLKIAQVLARDGEFERAEAALAKVDPAAPGLDLVLYHTVAGMVALNRERPEAAAEHFRAALAAGATEPLLHLYLAQALALLERWHEAALALEQGGEALAAIASTHLLRAHALWMGGRRAEAFAVLETARRRFGDGRPFERRAIFYLIEAGLFAEAAERGVAFLEAAEPREEDYVAIGKALTAAGSAERAVAILERARLRFPASTAVTQALAQAWLRQGATRAAAELTATLAERDPRLLPEAAELMRRSGQRSRALLLNARIEDSAKRLKQRVGLLLELRRYDQVAALEPALERAGLLADEDIRYALAYAFFQAGDFAAAERHLATITRPELFRRATELRRIMGECAEARWQCG
ncbi:MAG: hypothetical protein RML12_01505 [Xanthomonadales bacterium]|nr:hypothetical protein [Xanthomonadales bacterium]